MTEGNGTNNNGTKLLTTGTGRRGHKESDTVREILVSLQTPVAVTAENSAVTAMDPNLKAHAFKPGQSGNPGGRPKGFGAYIREKTKEGKLLVDDALAVLADEQATDAARSNARTFLAAYGFGKPVETQDVNLTTRAVEQVKALAPFLDASKKDELARYLSAIESDAGRS